MPATDRSEAIMLMRRTAAALEASNLAQPIAAESVPDVREAMAHVDLGGVVAAEHLRDVAKLVAIARRLRGYAKERRSDVPLLAEILMTDPTLDPLATAITRAIDEHGRILDGASSALRSARQRVRQTRKSLLEKLGRLTRKFGDVLRDATHVELDGRYGLPVRADAHRKVEGIVLSSSSTGATLYVEPPAVTALSNKLRLAEGEVEREEARVLYELSAKMRELVEPLHAAFETCVEADVLAALARWGRDCRGVAIDPDEGATIDLRRMRHPLLVVQGGEVVANDIILSAGAALVISGPNAGGKTVALKCLGLSVWMARAGVPLPVQDGSRIGWFGRVLTDIGDEQSIERSLSTFSAHVTNLAAILERADERALVLLDEVAGGTDPDEGSVLAAAVLEALVNRGAAVATTTHYERLKELAAEDARFENASVGFDFDEMQPTFALTLGVPGASSALSVASRHGMPAAIVDRARGLLSQPSVKREELLARLQKEQRAAAEARESAERDAKAASVLRDELQQERHVVREKERKKLERERDAMIGEVRKARAELRTLLEEARSQASSGSREAIRRAEQATDAAAKVVAVGAPIDKATRTTPAGSSASGLQLQVGMQVWVERLGSTAEIVDPPDRGEVRVRAGAFALRVPVGELRIPTQDPKKAMQKAKAKLNQKARQKHSRAQGHKAGGAAGRHAAHAPETADQRALRTSLNTCDLRGQRVDEALMALDRFVDDHSRDDPREPGFVLHGHGTGALKKAVRDHLSLSARIAKARPAEQAEGGDAFTIFWLR